MKNYTIGQIAKIVGLSTKTIRFYEEVGLVSPAPRSENGYRVYSPSSVEELMLLKNVRDLGLPLDEIKKLMKGCENGNCCHTKEHVRSIIDNHLAQLTNKIDQLNSLTRKLTILKENLAKHKEDKSSNYCCDVLHQIVSLTNREGGDKE